jgi:hypothetical protein
VANFVYPSAKQMLLEANLNWLTDPIYAILINTQYYAASLGHTSLADVDAQAFVVSSSLLTGRTTTNGVADADDLVFSPTAGPICQALILVKDGSTAIQSKLIAYIDTARGLPYTPDGTSIKFVWDDALNRIFAL